MLGPTGEIKIDVFLVLMRVRLFVTKDDRPNDPEGRLAVTTAWTKFLKNDAERMVDEIEKIAAEGTPAGLQIKMSSKAETSDLYAMFKGSEQFKLMQIDDFVEKVSNAEKQGGNLGFITIKSLAVYFKEWTDLTQTYSTLYKFINSDLFKD